MRKVLRLYGKFKQKFKIHLLTRVPLHCLRLHLTVVSPKRQKFACTLKLKWAPM